MSDVRRRARSLDGSEPRAQAILDTAVDAILTIDPSGSIESANRATTLLFGYSERELLGRNVKMLMPARYADEHDGYLERYRATGKARIIGSGRDVTARRSDGTLFPARLAVGELEIDGKKLFAGILHDLSETREAQTRASELGAILEESVNEIYVFDDRTLRFKRANRVARENLGYTLDELRQLTPTDIKPDFDTDSFQNLLAPLRDGRMASLNFKTSLRRKNGSDYRVEIQLQYRAADGEFLAIILDITDREALEAQLLQSQKMEAIGTLAGGIAHDFNNLLTSIRGSSEILLDALEPEGRLHRSAARIYKATERATALTTQLLGFSRKQVTRRVILDVNEAVREIESLFAHTLPEDVDLVFDLAPGGLHVRADEGQIAQVLMNLVVNARDAMPQGGRVVLTTGRETVPEVQASGLGVEAGSFVRIGVADSGVGMAPDVRAQVFDPFYTTKEPGKGTGLGLSTAFAIVRNHAGVIRIESEPGEGSSFELLLPEADEPLAAPDSTAVPNDVAGASGEWILLVEDDDIMREMLGEVLEEGGYRVLQAGDPDQALRCLAGHTARVALLITDVVMPKMNGVLLANVVRESEADIRVLFMSGYTDQELANRGDLSLDDPFMRKPFGNAALLEKVREVLGSSG